MCTMAAAGKSKQEQRREAKQRPSLQQAKKEPQRVKEEKYICEKKRAQSG